VQEQVFQSVRKEIRALRASSPGTRKRELHALYKRWHPDKNPSDPDFATKVFQMIQEELRERKK
jgi:curved DNA-binding protein CbpA